MKANKETCKEQFIDLAQMLNRCDDLEKGLLEFYRKLDLPVNLKTLGIPKEDLKKIAFDTSRDAVNMATDPISISEQKILELLLEIYE